MVRWPWTESAPESLPPDPDGCQRCFCACHFPPYAACGEVGCCGSCRRCAILYVRRDLERHEAGCQGLLMRRKRRRGEVEDGVAQARRLDVQMWRLGPPRLCSCHCHRSGACHAIPCCGECPRCHRNWSRGLDEHVRACAGIAPLGR